MKNVLLIAIALGLVAMSADELSAQRRQQTPPTITTSHSKAEQYQLVVQWAPPWAGSLLNLQLASDWNRRRTGLEPQAPGFDGQRVLTLTLQWSAARNWQAEGAAP